MGANDYILQKYENAKWNEKLVTPESGKVLGFDAGLNPVMMPTLFKETNAFLDIITVNLTATDLTGISFFAPANARCHIELKFRVLFADATTNQHLYIRTNNSGGVVYFTRNWRIPIDPYVINTYGQVGSSINYDIGNLQRTDTSIFMLTAILKSTVDKTFVFRAGGANNMSVQDIFLNVKAFG